MNTVLSDKIADLNDKYRRTGIGFTITRKVQALRDLPRLIYTIQHYNYFTKDVDPFGEHDFGFVAWGGQKIYWKIDYYDQSMKYYGDPYSETCRRVLTVMLASEY